MTCGVASQAMTHMELRRVTRRVPSVFVYNQRSPFCRFIDKQTFKNHVVPTGQSVEIICTVLYHKYDINVTLPPPISRLRNHLRRGGRKIVRARSQGRVGKAMSLDMTGRLHSQIPSSCGFWCKICTGSSQPTLRHETGRVSQGPGS